MSPIVNEQSGEAVRKTTEQSPVLWRFAGRENGVAT
jgi:hypothetical protein